MKHPVGVLTMICYFALNIYSLILCQVSLIFIIDLFCLNCKVLIQEHLNVELGFRYQEMTCTSILAWVFLVTLNIIFTLLLVVVDASSNNDPENGKEYCEEIVDRDDDIDARYIQEEEIAMDDEDKEKQIDQQKMNKEEKITGKGGGTTDKEDKRIYKSNKVKKTKLEKSLEMLTESFANTSKRETEMMIQLEERRQKATLDHELKMKELDNERRREERQHEILLYQMMCNNRYFGPAQQEQNFNSNTMYTNPVVQYNQQDGSSQSTYFKL